MSILKNIPKIVSIAVHLFPFSILASGFDVSGTVFEDDSVTIMPGTEIYAYERGTNDAVIPPVCVAQTVTDQDGKYTVTLDGTAQRYYIMAECVDISKGFGKRIKKWISGPTTTAHIYMEDAHDGFTTITGTVTNSSGSVVSNAKVVLRTKVSSGGTSRFNVDSAVTDNDGNYLIQNAQVKLPETVGEKVASFHIYANGYKEGVVDPLAMVSPDMVVDFVLNDSTGVIVAQDKKTTAAFTPHFTINSSSITINGLTAPSQVKIFTANGTKIEDRFLLPEKNRIQIKKSISHQYLIIEIIAKFDKSVHRVFFR